MLKRYATFVTLFRGVFDICMIMGVWLSVYYIRFYSGGFDSTKGIPDFKRHLILTLPVVFICFLGCFFSGLYKPKRIQRAFDHFINILKATLTSGLFLLAFFYYLQEAPYSRILLALFILLLLVGWIFSHLITMAAIRIFRKQGYNLRRYAVIGTGTEGRELVQDIRKTGWTGLKCSFFIDNDPHRIGTTLLGVPVTGPVEKLTEIIQENRIDEIYLSTGGDEAQRSYPVLKELQSAGITIRIIPDWSNLISINRATAVTIGSQVLFSAADSPLDGINIIVKEVFDRVFALLLLTLFAIPMTLIAVLIKLTSKGPVFYRQIRIGMDQKEFHILKFRTMTIHAEKNRHTQWTREEDPRRTQFGAWLRKTSLDELPQLVNVLLGQMSLVGPRPERPVFVRKFSEDYQKYMLRHKVKAGMTGWAQIHGLRGDTSLRKRLLYDLYYIRNWSLGLDIWILLRTPWHIIKGVNAY